MATETETLDALKGEVAEHKRRAGDLSAEVLRLRKDVGERDNALEEMASLKAANDQLKAENADLAAQLKAAQRDAKAAAARLDEVSAKIEAATKIAEGLKAL